MLKQVLVVGAFVLAGVVNAAAQDGFMAWGEVGKPSTAHGDGSTRSGMGGGGGFQFIIGGAADKDRGVIAPVGMELKYYDSLDLVFSGDIGFRIKSVSFGPGATFNVMSRPFLEDPDCVRSLSVAQSSCYRRPTDNATTRDLGGFFGLAPSGFVKASFGPQGRAFVQLRYFKYLPSLISYQSFSELSESLSILAGSFGSNTTAVQVEEPFHPVDYPEFKGGQDVRISGGYVLGKHVIVRAQMSDKRFDFTPVLGNVRGIFDQKTRTYTIGIGIR